MIQKQWKKKSFLGDQGKSVSLIANEIIKACLNQDIIRYNLMIFVFKILQIYRTQQGQVSATVFALNGFQYWPDDLCTNDPGGRGWLRDSQPSPA